MKFFTPRRLVFGLGALAAVANAAAPADGKGKADTTITIPTGIPPAVNSTLAANNITIPSSKKGYIVIDLTLGGTTQEQQTAVKSIVDKVGSWLNINATGKLGWDGSFRSWSTR